jgi:hypothetical protein
LEDHVFGNWIRILRDETDTTEIDLWRWNRMCFFVQMIRDRYQDSEKIIGGQNLHMTKGQDPGLTPGKKGAHTLHLGIWVGRDVCR